MCLVKCEISLPCSISKKKRSFFRVLGIHTDLSYFKTPQISLAASARDILVNFEISLAIFILNNSRIHAISYTNTFSFIALQIVNLTLAIRFQTKFTSKLYFRS